MRCLELSLGSRQIPTLTEAEVGTWERQVEAPAWVCRGQTSRDVQNGAECGEQPLWL